MGYDKMITASMKVLKPNFVELHPGGWYNLNENNYVETAVVKLHMLSQFCDMMAEAYANAGENNVLLGHVVEVVAERLFEEYRPFIEAGCDIFSYADFYDRKTLDKYQKRPIVNGQMNMADDEQTPGLPKGWHYEFPGQAQKMFDCGLLVIDHDEHVRIGVYEKSTDDQPIDMIYITQRGNYQQVFRQFEGNALEILEACEFIYNENHI